jgi:hypothetical protein
MQKTAKYKKAATTRQARAAGMELERAMPLELDLPCFPKTVCSP